MTNFFGKFILGYAKLAAPLIELTKKTAVWQRTDECRQAFNRLKQALVEAPALAIPDPAAPFELVTDSCGHGIEAVLLQHDKPVAFYSRNMTDAERCYVHHEQELLAAITALKVFRCYLLGNKFNLVTDDKPNTYLDTQPTLSRRRARWSEYLQRFHFNWVNLARSLSSRNAHIRYGIKSWRLSRTFGVLAEYWLPIWLRPQVGLASTLWSHIRRRRHTPYQSIEPRIYAQIEA